MKCKIHPYEPGVGVCASCLRERLLTILAAQLHHSSPPHRHQNSDPSPPPLLFPRSVSPYVSHRRSDSSATYLHRFYSTPQVGHAGEDRKRKKKKSLFSSLFGRLRSEDSEQDSRVSGSSSWFSALIPDRRKKKSPERRKSLRARDRGMSPEEEVAGEDSASESGYSTESPGGWRRTVPTPMRAPPSQSHHRRGVSGFAVCLSPLVRASPNSRRGHVAEVGVSSEPRSSIKQLHHRHVSAGAGGAALDPNRSRKLADIGRFQ